MGQFGISKTRNVTYTNVVGNAAGHMSKSNKDIVKEFIHATNNRDWDKFENLVTVDFIRHSSSDSVTVDSRDKLKEFHQRELVTFPDIKETILLLIQEGDYVAAEDARRRSQFVIDTSYVIVARSGVTETPLPIAGIVERVIRSAIRRRDKGCSFHSDRIQA